MNKTIAHLYENIRRMLADQQDAILVLDTKYIVRFANRAAIDLFGDKVADGMEFGIPITKEGSYEELDIPRADGTLFTVEMRLAKTVWYGEPAFVISLRDITERIEAKARLEHLNRVLHAVRDINKLIVREKKPKKLIKEACELLIHARGYTRAWIAVGEP